MAKKPAAKPSVAEVLGKRVILARRQAKRVCGECGLELGQVVKLFQRTGFPSGGLLSAWKAKTHTELVATELDIDFDGIDWEAVIEKLGPIVEKMFEKCME